MLLQFGIVGFAFGSVIIEFTLFLRRFVIYTPVGFLAVISVKRKYSVIEVVYDKMHQLKIDYTKEELEIFDEKHKAQMREKQQRGYSLKDREVTSATITVVLGDVYHGTRQGKKLDDIFIETAEATHRSVEAVRKIYEENKDFIKVIEKQWESYDPPPQDRSASKNRRTGHLTNED